MPAKKIKILFIGPHRPNRNGSQRFRMEQFFPYLRNHGFVCDYSWFISERGDKVFYSRGHWFDKLGVFTKAFLVRLRDVLRANNYDIIFIQREAFMTGSVFFEKKFSKSKAKVVFDFDDAIWLYDVSSFNKRFKWLKRPGKTADIITLSDLIIAGNSFLAEYARQFNSSVEIIPTVIDTSQYLPTKKAASDTKPVCIGWSGSKTTIKHFALIMPVLKKLKKIYGDRIIFLQIGDSNFKDDELKIESKDWNFEDELKELTRIDIGLMPLPDDKWSKGKCGFKALQYMALEIPPVVSPVGVNTEIIEHTVNGFFANDEEEWMAAISKLIVSSELRNQIGIAARQTVIQRYSLQVFESKMELLLRGLVG